MNQLNRDIIGGIVNVKCAINGTHTTATELLLDAIALSNPLPSESVRGAAHETSGVNSGEQHNKIQHLTPAEDRLFRNKA
jgi:hypothetical protein